MRTRLIPVSTALGALVLVAAFLAAPVVHARGRVEDDIVQNVVKTVREIPIQDLFIAAGVFLVFGIFAKYQESRGIYVLGSFLMTMVCIGVGVVTFVTSDAMDHPRVIQAFAAPNVDPNGVAPAAAAPAPAEAAPAPAAAAPAPVAAAPASSPVIAAAPSEVGAVCRKSSDCRDGTVCAHVAGSRHCWAPCGANGACGAGYACMASGHDQSVCVR